MEMISMICLFWVGVKLNAPTWYFGLIIFGLIVTIFQFAAKMYKAGMKAIKDNEVV